MSTATDQFMPIADSTNAISAALRTSARLGCPIYPTGWSAGDIITVFGGSLLPILAPDGKRVVRGSQGWEAHVRF